MLWGESDVKLNVQVPLLEGVPMLRHALAGHPLEIARLDHLSRGVLDDQVAPVEVLQHHGEPAQRLGQRYRVGHNQVRARPLETVVGLLLQDDDHIAWLHVGLSTTQHNKLARMFGNNARQT